jgi:hypothetical protein
MMLRCCKENYFINFVSAWDTVELKQTNMKEFVLLFRRPGYDERNDDQEKKNALVKKWDDWVSGIVAEGKLITGGNRLSMDGKVLKPGGVITDGPFVEIKEKLGGFAIVQAESLDEATTLAHGCPILDEGGSVEIRPVFK